MKRRLALLVAMTLSVARCGGTTTPASPTPSTVVSPAGNWSGAITDAVSGEGTVTLSLSEQAGSSLVGTWTATFKNGDSFTGPGGATVLPEGYGIFLYVQPQPPCATVSGPGPSALLGFTLINVVVTSNRLTAVSGRLSCSGIGFGTVSLSKQ